MLITLTEPGRELIDRIIVDHANVEAKLLNDLSRSDQERLTGLLRELLVSLGDHSPGNPLNP